MKASELRIGNIVNTAVGIIQVVEIPVRSNPLYNPNALHPVPLTEEWVLKFGFETITIDESGNRNYWSKELDASIDIEPTLTDSKIEELFYYRIHEKLRRKSLLYVHQLQNLYFALTGKELDLTTN